MGLTAKTALAIALQPTEDTFANPTAADIYPISSLQFQIEGQTIDNDEYLGTIIRNGAEVTGKKVTISFTTKLRPPGGTAPPTANSWIPGRLFQSAKYTEVVNAAAIPAAPEAYGVGSTTTKLKLGTSALATAGLYKGFPILLSDKGATFKSQLSSVRNYTAAKDAELMEVLSAAPTGTYQIPPFVGYFSSVSETDPPFLSMVLWLDGHRFNLVNARCTGLPIVVPTTTKDQSAYAELQWSFDLSIESHLAEATPVIPPLGAVPMFRNGDMMLNRVRIGTQTFTIANTIQAESPPNPNKEDGSDGAQMTGATASVSVTWQKYLPSVIDPLALADAQQQIPFFAQWGTGSGNIVQVSVPDVRPNYQNPDLGGSFIMQSGDLMIDAFERRVGIVFPYAA